MLKIPEHLREISRPFFQFRVIFGRNAEHLRRDDGWERSGEIRDHVHLPTGLHTVEQFVGYLLNVTAQNADTMRSKGDGSQAAQPRVRGRVHKKHLLHHHLGDWVHAREAHRGELRR